MRVCKREDHAKALFRSSLRRRGGKGMRRVKRGKEKEKRIGNERRGEEGRREERGRRPGDVRRGDQRRRE